MTEAATSSSVGDYVKAIWELAEAPADGASTKDIAARLSVAPASVTNMLIRLQERGLVQYERYRGAVLTDEGRSEALRLIRRHRLIETFLLEHLGYSWQEVHDEAEKLEHAVSDLFTERLAELLSYPNHDPHGHPIPKPDGSLPAEELFALSEAEDEQSVVISRVSDDNASRLSYLGERGLVPGSRIRVREVRELDGVVIVEDEAGETFSLGGPLAHSILVQSF
ncbi:MAG: metal-dependent transcriptional regulator [Rubrobacter sp.]|nr:metal-dependent transcriptional regulator [Rubrobacter sp.]